MSLYDTVKQELEYFLNNISQAYSYHRGPQGQILGETEIDVGLPYHTPIYATAPGRVIGAGYYGGGGVVTVQIGNTVSEYYQHLSEDIAKVGDVVNVGTLIGYSGGQLGYGLHPSSSAFSTGPHLEIGFNAPYGGMWKPLGNSFNPVPLLQQQENNIGSNNPIDLSAFTNGGIGAKAVLGNPNDTTAVSVCGPEPNSADFRLGIFDPQFVWQHGQWQLCQDANNGIQAGGPGTPVAGIAADVNSGAQAIAGGILGGLGNLVSAPFQSVGVTSFADLLWRAVFIFIAVLIVIVAIKGIASE